jgi:uncharacterized membrane protein
VSTYGWLLALHVTGAFLMIGGSAAAGILNVLARRQERPSDVALFFTLVRYSVPAIGVGALLTLVLGLWLVHHRGYSLWEFWILAALVLWAAGMFLGARGGRKQDEARELALRLAAAGDAPSAELQTKLREPVPNLMSWGAGLAFLVVLVLMVWKPGS